MSQSVVRPVQGTVQDGTMITIQGSVNPNAQGFSINLTSGPGELGTSDIALHMNPRYNENSCVRNSFRNGNWENEDRSDPNTPPVPPGQPFEAIILVQNAKFMIAFNGRHFCEFAHRVPKERITHVIVKGDVQVNNVNFAGGAGGAPPAQPGVVPGGPAGAQCVNIAGGMRPGRIIYINATPNPNATRFGVNLKYQQSGGDLALHFSPRFQEHRVIKNALQNGSWGMEEVATNPFPFVPGAPFQMMILADPQEFKIAVNGAHFTEFRLRNPNLGAVQWVEVEGDVTNVAIQAP